ncbi:GIY-YIG nuclease family protein [bacterium]|nr:GIY-YIG nuclease family protein [bacterium]
MLLSDKDGNFYTGSTKDLIVRFYEHNAGRVKFTIRRKPFKLICYEAYLDGADAMREDANGT